MAVIALSMWWTVGWVVAAVVIVLVAGLLLTITALARKIDGAAQQLVNDLDSIAQKTRPLHDVGRTNMAVRAITRGLRIARGEAGSAPNRYSTSPGWRE
ncbi:MAG TPA: hypothetical protein VGO81_00990 [Solirubrobacteraceae bacterium]|jgi:hypothetical protein|nr:hypothetical protein [Solirubrobacteraceae bacterium]